MYSQYNKQIIYYLRICYSINETSKWKKNHRKMLYTYRHPSFEYLSWEDLEILIKDLETNDNTKEEVYIN